MLDEALLDDPGELTGADEYGLLRGLASAGARVRTAARLADEAGLAALRPDGRPRTVLVAGRGPAADAGELLATVAGNVCPVLPLRPVSGTGTHPRWVLPGWTGPLDLLLLATPDGEEQGLVSLVEQAYGHGCTVVVVAPAGSALASAAQQARGMALPFAPPSTGFSPQASPLTDPAQNAPSVTAPAVADAPTARPLPGDPARRTAPGRPHPEDTGALWALLVPLLALTDRLGVAHLPPSAVQGAADLLDEIAAACGPATPTYQNRAKTLAVELAGTLPLLWSEGTAAEAAARRFAACLAHRAGLPALSATLPEALTTHEGLLAGPLADAVEDDFFRDRLEDAGGLRLRVVLLRDRAPAAAASEASPAHLLARTHGTPVSEVTAGADSPLEAMARLLALTDFASAYLALADRP
ncbi:SIS domain-containing protein [Streptomyces capparidis]